MFPIDAKAHIIITSTRPFFFSCGRVIGTGAGEFGDSCVGELLGIVLWDSGMKQRGIMMMMMNCFICL